MAKSLPTPADIKTKLIVKKDFFKEQLTARITIGESLFSRIIRSLPEFESLKKEYDDWNDYNSELLKHSFNTTASEYKQSYDVCTEKYIYSSFANIQDEINGYKDDIRDKINNLNRLVNKLDLMESEIDDKSTTTTTNGASAVNEDIFIVHGHNNEKKLEVYLTLKALGLNPIILHEQANSGKTIIEKFESNANVGYAVVLLTDDDDGKSKKTVDYQSRARQNVILELGYFIGRLGRSKVCPLYSNGVELPNDLSGVVYTELDMAGLWKYSLAKELQAAGYKVDMNKI